MMPWCGMLPERRSRVSRDSKRSGMPWRPAFAMASSIRRLRTPLAMRRRSKWRDSALSASRTGLMPQIRSTLLPLAEQDGGDGGDALATAGGSQPVRALGLDGHALRLQRQAAAERRAHLVYIRGEDGLLGDHRHVDVLHREAARVHEPRRALEEARPARVLPSRVGAREVPSHVAFARRPQQGVAQGVDRAVAVGVALQAAGVRHLHTPEHQLAPGNEAVGIEAGADTAPAHWRPSLRSRVSAQARSSGVVSLRLRAEPFTATTGSPRRSRAIASSVRTTSSRNALS